MAKYYKKKNTLKGIHRFQKLNRKESELAIRNYENRVAPSHGQKVDEPWEHNTRVPALPLCKHSSLAPCYQVIHPSAFTFSKPKEFAFRTTLLLNFN